jgi:hypothetical protein
MKKVLVLLSLLTALAVTAGDNSNLSVEAGYNSQYIVNGVARSEATPFVGVGAVKSLKYADVYLGGTLLVNGDQDQSHWTLGTGKEVDVWKDVFSARADATVTRHQTGGSFGIPNSTEFGVKLALPNKLATPYVRGAFDIDLDQKGAFVGIERAQKLPFGFVITPGVEYGKVFGTTSDFTAVNVKATLTRPFEFSFGVLTPFASVGWYDNNFHAAKYNWATREFSGDVVYSGGLRLSF